jgi:type IV secretory pathway VirB10-like protein
MSGLSRGAKSARLMLFAVVIAICSILPGFLPGSAERQEPVRTTAGSLPDRESRLTVSAPIMSPEQRIKFYLTYGGAFVFVLVLITVLVLWIFFTTRKDMEDEEDDDEDDDDAPRTASPSEQRTTHTLPTAKEDTGGNGGALEPTQNLQPAKREEPARTEESAKIEEKETADEAAKTDGPRGESEAPASKET